MILALPGTVIGLPDFTTRFGLSLADRGLFIATLFGSLLVGSILSGAVVDHAGYRRSIGTSAAGLAILLPLLATAPSYRVALFALAGLGLVAAPLNTAANALSSELFPAERGRHMTQLAIAFSSGGLLLPAVTAAAAAFVSWRTVVVGGAVVAATTAVAALTGGALATPPREGSLGSALGLFRRHGFVACCVLLVCGAANEGTFAGWTSSYLSAEGFTPVAATAGLSSHWLGLLIGRSLLAGRVDRNKYASVVRGALSGAAVLLAMLVWPAHPVLAVGPFVAGRDDPAAADWRRGGGRQPSRRLVRRRGQRPGHRRGHRRRSQRSRMIPERYAPQVYALFRIVFGFFFLLHGLQKIVGLFGGLGGNGAVPLGSLMGVAGIIETTTGTLILLGLFTRVAAFVASGMMAYAYFTVHFPNAPWPLLNGGEPAAMNAFAFLYIAARGSGIWSVDSVRK